MRCGCCSPLRGTTTGDAYKKALWEEVDGIQRGVARADHIVAGIERFVSLRARAVEAVNELRAATRMDGGAFEYLWEDVDHDAVTERLENADISVASAITIEACTLWECGEGDLDFEVAHLLALRGLEMSPSDEDRADLDAVVRGRGEVAGPALVAGRPEVEAR